MLNSPWPNKYLQNPVCLRQVEGGGGGGGGREGSAGVGISMSCLSCVFLCTVVHSPREIISMAGKTGYNARWKRKTKLKIIHPYQQ